jgi:hypothetical protein
VVLDAAPTGQILLPTKTQGGAGACPGLWDKAPLGLKLVPFGLGPSVCWDLFFEYVAVTSSAFQIERLTICPVNQQPIGLNVAVP